MMICRVIGTKYSTSHSDFIIPEKAHNNVEFRGKFKAKESACILVWHITAIIVLVGSELNHIKKWGIGKQ